MERPLKIAVICPIYLNSERSKRNEFFQEALDSLLANDSDFYGIIVDDGSPNDIVRKIVRHLNDDRIIYLRREKKQNENKTSSNPINYAVELLLSDPEKIDKKLVSSQISQMCYFHSDDILSKDSLSVRSVVLQNNDFIFSDRAFIDEESNFIKTEKSVKYSKKTFYQFPHHTLMWKTSFVKGLIEYNKNKFKIDRFMDPNLSYAEDRDLTINTFNYAKTINAKWEHIEKVTYLYRINRNDSLTANANTKKNFSYLGDKHKFRKNELYFDVRRKLTGNLPFSLLTFLPEKIKKHLRSFNRDKSFE